MPRFGPPAAVLIRHEATRVLAGLARHGLHTAGIACYAASFLPRLHLGEDRNPRCYDKRCSDSDVALFYHLPQSPAYQLTRGEMQQSASPSALEVTEAAVRPGDGLGVQEGAPTASSVLGFNGPRLLVSSFNSF